MNTEQSEYLAICKKADKALAEFRNAIAVKADASTVESKREEHRRLMFQKQEYYINNRSKINEG